MKLIKGKDANINYLAKVVRIDSFKKHSDPEVNKLKCCTIDGYNMITGIDSEAGLYIYFPTDCCINPKFLEYANLYRDSLLNKDRNKTGLFEDNGRVKSVRLRGELSEGFIIPALVFQNWIMESINIDTSIIEGMEFDSVEHDGKVFWVNKKYIPNNKSGCNKLNVNNARGKHPKGINKIIDGQFHFHYDTTLIKKCPNVINPSDIISITAKVHGTSGISSYVLCKQNLNWKQRIAKLITGEAFNKYDYLYSSRSVIKNKLCNTRENDGFYNIDIWAYADKIIRPFLSKGMSIYYEIIGFIPSGGYIQKNYDYGYMQPQDDSHYEYGKNFGIQIYRITLTDCDGLIHEFSAKEVQQWCNSNNLIPVEEYFYGYAKDLYSDLCIDDKWNATFLSKLANDKSFFMEYNSPTCKNAVPHEGIVIRIENMKSEAFKLKCFNFIDGEGKLLDKGETDIETKS